MGTECFTEQDSRVKQSAWNSRDSIKLKVKTAIIYWVPLCTEYWCLACMIKLINSLHFSGTHQSTQWVDIIFQSSQYSSFTDEDKRLDSQPCQDSHQWTKDSDKGLPDSQTGCCHGSLQSQCCLPLSLSESRFILESLPHPTPLPAICFAHRVPAKGKPMANRESTFYTAMHTHKWAMTGTVTTSHLLKKTKMIKKNPPFTFITEELLLNPEFQSTFFRNPARWSGRGQGEGRPLTQHCPWPPPGPGTLRATSPRPPSHHQWTRCSVSAFQVRKQKPLPQDAATQQPKPNPVCSLSPSDRVPEEVSISIQHKISWNSVFSSQSFKNKILFNSKYSILKTLLKYSCFTLPCEFLLYSKLN